MKRFYLHFPLNETKGDVARDVVQNKQAKVNNPVWIGPLHSSWKEVVLRTAKGVLLEAADEENNKLYLLSNEKLFFVI